MRQLIISEQIRNTCPQYSAAVISCQVTNSVSSDALWCEINTEIDRIRATYAMDQINKRTEIAATRSAYKKLGKDPNRYRPSAEALCRRIIRELSLYQVNTLVDLINLISIHTGYSIGGFDADKIEGDLELGVGKANEEFEAIGRGMLNIEGLPVYRDRQGGIGTPTSDNERTKINNSTHQLLMIINDYSKAGNLNNAVEYSLELLRKFADAEDVKVIVVD